MPVFSGRSKTPAFIFCCYSFVRSTSIPFVLKFVQQALKLLWCGLDNVEPHESVEGDLWKQVAPADLGEMAADVEMHQHFMIKKRPIGAISTELDSRDESVKALTVQVNSLENISGAPMASSIYTGQVGLESQPLPQVQIHTFEGMHSQIHDATKSVADMKPAHRHIATNANGSKRVHVLLHEPLLTYPQQQSQPYMSQKGQHETVETNPNGFRPATSNPLPLSQPFRLPNQIVQNQIVPNQVIHPINNDHSMSYSQGTQIQYLSSQQTQLQTKYNSPQNQFGDYSVNNSNSNSYSFSTMHQHQQKQQEQVPVPTPVYSLPTTELNAAGTPLSSFTPQNTTIVNGINHTRPVKNATPRASSGRSKNASNTKVRIFMILTNYTNLLLIFRSRDLHASYPVFRSTLALSYSGLR